MATEAELKTRIAELQPGAGLLNRKLLGTPEELVDYVHELVARALLTDVDAPFHLLLLAVRRLQRIATRAQTGLATIQGAVTAARQPVPRSTASTFATALKAIDALPGVRVGRASLVTRYQAAAKALAAATRLADGSQKLDTHESAAAALSDGLTTYADDLDDLRVVLPRVSKLLASISLLDLPAKVSDRQARHGTTVLVGRLQEDAHLGAAAAIDAIILSGLLTQAQSVLDYTADKYTGTVTTLPGTAAFLLGSTMPLQGAAAAATVTADGAHTGDVQAPAATKAVVSILGAATFFNVAALGSVGTSNGGAGPYSFVLKGWMIGATVKVFTTVAGVRALRTTDNGAGAWGAGAAGGALAYDTGICTLTLSVAPDANTSIDVEYFHDPLSDLRSRDAAGANPVSFAQFRAFRQNTLVSGNVANAHVTTAAALATNIQTAINGNGLTVAHDAAANAWTVTSDDRGTGAQVMFPDEAGVPEMNLSSAVAPTWKVAPANLNEALGALYDRGGRAFGKDVYLGQLVLTGALVGKVALTLSVQLLARSQTASVATANKDRVTVPTGVCAVGDTILVTAPVRSVHKVASIVSPTVVSVTPQIPFPITTPPTTLPNTVDVTFDISRDKLRLASLSVASDSALSVGVAALGLTGTAKGVYNQVQLVAAPALAYTIRPNDPVYQSGSKIGVVSKVSGTTLTLALTGGTFPFTSLVVKTLGYQSFLALAPLLDAVVLPDSAALNDAAIRYAHANVGKDQYDTAVAAATTALASLQAALAAYSAHTSRFSDVLFQQLRELKLSAVAARLLELDLAGVFSDDPTNFSDQGRLESLLRELADVHGGIGAEIIVADGTDTLRDYYHRPHDETQEPDYRRGR